MAESATGNAAAAASDRDRIIEALMGLLAERRLESIDFADIALRADVPLAKCRETFSSPMAVLGAYLRDLDQKVLAGAETDMADEPSRERLFDALMRRLDAMTPHKAAMRSLLSSARCNPALAACLNAMAVRSQAWMLTSSGISTGGLRGAIRAQGMAGLYARVMRVWVRDEDPGLARTMAALDRELSRGERWDGMLRRLCGCLPGSGRSRWRPRDRHAHDPGEQPAVV